jgi:hypothetical protein
VHYETTRIINIRYLIYFHGHRSTVPFYFGGKDNCIGNRNPRVGKRHSFPDFRCFGDLAFEGKKPELIAIVLY